MFHCIFQAIFERFDRDRSGRIDSSELCDGLLTLGYSVSSNVNDFLSRKIEFEWSTRVMEWSIQANLCVVVDIAY